MVFPSTFVLVVNSAPDLGMRAGADGGGSMIGLYDPLADVEP
jgi:hypothetical protein